MATKKAAKAAKREKAAAAKAKATTELETLGNEIAKRIVIADKALSTLKEQAAGAFKDFVGHRESIAKLLAEAQKKCKAAGMKFEAFRQKYAPNFSRSLTYDLVAIGSGKITIEDHREKKKQQKRAERAAKNPSTTTPVVETPAELTDEQAKARMAALDAPPTAPDHSAGPPDQAPGENAEWERELGADPAVPAPDQPPNDSDPQSQFEYWAAKLSIPQAMMAIADVTLKGENNATPFEMFKAMCEVLLPRMNTPTRVEARKLVTTISHKADEASRRAAEKAAA